MIKPSSRISALALLVIACAGLLAGCGSEDKKQIAAEVAAKWTDTSINDASDAVAELIIGEKPIVTQLAGRVLAGRIRENLSWEYSEPERKGEDRYVVIATATADIKVEVPPLIDRRYVASLPFKLDVDTGAKNVSKWVPDFLAAKIEERDG